MEDRIQMKIKFITGNVKELIEWVKEDDEMADPKYQRTGSIDYRLIEECAELTKAICKAERFGYDNFHPKRPRGSRRNNKTDILKEIKDVKRLLDEMEIFLNKKINYART